MKILHFSWSDRSGGAARATFRLHRALHSIGVDSSIMVSRKESTDPYVLGPDGLMDRVAGRIAARWDQKYLRSYQRRTPGLFSPAKAATQTVKRADGIPRDISHLHWVTNGFLRIEDLSRLDQPLVWTLHDQWAFTGGCHYSNGCVKFNDSCGSCPHLNSQIQNDLSRETWERKYSAWRNVHLTLIAPSRWLSRLTASSALFRDRRVEVIPNCIDIDVFQPCDQAAARRVFSLPPNRKILLFCALTADGDQRKGFHFLHHALERLAKNVERDSITLAVMGMRAPSARPTAPFPIHPLGILQEDRKVALAYAAADVFLAPSMEDNLPNTVMEALSCGTPCVAFNIGGMSDMIDHQKNGYLAEAFDEDDLAMGIRWVLADEHRRRSLSGAARKKVVEEYGFEPIARHHVRLYEELTLTTKRTKGVEIC